MYPISPGLVGNSPAVRGGSGGIIVPNAVDNQNTAYSNATGLSNSASQGGTISFWLKGSAALTSNTYLLAAEKSGASKLYINCTSANRLRIFAWNSAGTSVLACTGPSYSNIATNWYYTTISFDLAASPVFHWWYSDNGGTLTDASVTPSTLASSETMSDIDEFTLTASFAQTVPINADFFDLWIDWNYLDMSSSTNQDKFFNGTTYVPLGADGSAPTGSAPDFFFSGSSANLGAVGGTFTDTGTYLTATAPVS